MSFFWFVVLSVAVFSIGFWLAKQLQPSLSQPSPWDAELPQKSNSHQAWGTGPKINLDQQVRQLMTQGKQVDAIKLVRQQNDWSLQEARFYVQQVARMEDGDGIPQNKTVQGISTDVQRQVDQLMEVGHKIKAIKLVRESTGWNLRQAREYVEGK